MGIWISPASCGGSGRHRVAGAAETLIKGDGYTPSHDGSFVYIHVDTIDLTLEAINSAGGKTLMPRMDIGQHGFIAHFEDTEGTEWRCANHVARPSPALTTPFRSHVHSNNTGEQK